jgi:hypothetical protein
MARDLNPLQDFAGLVRHRRRRRALIRDAATDLAITIPTALLLAGAFWLWLR